MTPRQISLARALGMCSFPPATAQKRVARQLSAQAEHASDQPITPRQAAYLCILIYRYRRQLPTRILIMAQDEAEELEQLAPGSIGCPPRPKPACVPRKRLSGAIQARAILGDRNAPNAQLTLAL